MEGMAKKFFKFWVNVAVAIVIGVYNVWLFMDIWNWFVSPTMGFSEIGVAMAYGLQLAFIWPITSILMYVGRTYQEKREKLGSFGISIVLGIVHTWVWLIAYVVANNFI